METERRCASMYRASTAFGILLTLAASLHVCSADSSKQPPTATPSLQRGIACMVYGNSVCFLGALRGTLREKAGVKLAASGQSLETSFPSNYRRQLTQADFEEIKITKVCEI